MNEFTTCATLVAGFTFLISSSAVYAIGMFNSPVSVAEAMDSMKLSFAGKLNEGATIMLLLASPGEMASTTAAVPADLIAAKG
ncbi:hypothetical protein BWP39_09250 [Paraburkholderia acidicola]|uniref:Uncharacterized protein n=1 Tax=Paraburkholderia acidicola TaxID=1912599 RepID=A0A2A4F2Z4_9BURK|nr:hypothetical protein BWP39_09250 [Paraburkholderia acidicola]